MTDNHEKPVSGARKVEDAARKALVENDPRAALAALMDLLASGADKPESAESIAARKALGIPHRWAM